MRWKRAVGCASVAILTVFCFSMDGKSRASTPAMARPTPSLKLDIASPADGSHRPWQGQVGYSVTASYDGKSTRFGEIRPNDVVMEARFLPNVATASQVGRDLPEALVTMSQSNCAGCHDFFARGAGPSYAAIGARYAGKPLAAKTLALRITNGSSGAWGGGVMPPHPDLTAAQARNVADWIIGHSNDVAVHYYIGNTGSFRMIPGGQLGPRAGIVATAFYTGALKPGDTRRSAEGKDRAVILGGSGS
jgi:cytochrome c551/c552